MEILKQGLVFRAAEGPFRYQAWPTIAQDENGVLYTAWSGLRSSHVCPFGKAVISYSEDEGRIASYNDAKKHITFQNSSRILFRYCDTEKDTLRFQGTEVDVLFIDEATQQSEEKMMRLKACTPWDITLLFEL